MATIRVEKIRCSQPRNQKALTGEDDGQHNADGPVVADEQQSGTYSGQNRGSVAQEPDVPADPAPLGAQGQERDQEFEVEIGRDGHQLQNDGRVPKAIEPGRAAGQLEEGDGRLEQFMQGQPEVFDMALLRKVERQQKDGQDQEQDGIYQPGQALEEVSGRPECERPVEIFPIAEAQVAIGEEACVGAIAEGNVGSSCDQGQRGFRRRNVQVVDAGDGLIVLREIPVRAFGIDQFSVGEDIHAGASGADAEGGGLRDGQLDQQGDGAMIGSQFEMEAEPGKAPWTRRRGICLPFWPEPVAG